MSKPQTPSLQNAILNAARKTKTTVTVFLMNGFQTRGVVKAHDNFTILLESDGKQNLMYKHAVSTVQPIRPLDIDLGPYDNGKADE